jgi:hypothetical protein
MPRQNFLSSDFFARTNEAIAKQALTKIPEHLPNIQFLKENALVQSMRFLYVHPDKQVHNYIDVSLLSLDDQYVRFSLHASYTNGQAFYTDPDISNALHNFEQAVQASLSNDYSYFNQDKKVLPKKPSYIVNAFLSMIGLLFLWKKMTS